MMYLALSYDHRIVDGKEAVTFLVRVGTCLNVGCIPSKALLHVLGSYDEAEARAAGAWASSSTGVASTSRR
jgi:hypothetical protein